MPKRPVRLCRFTEAGGVVRDLGSGPWSFDLWTLRPRVMGVAGAVLAWKWQQSQ